MGIEEYVVGQPVRYRGRFYDDPAMTEPVDPSTVTLFLRDPAGTDTSYLYSADVDREEEGVFSSVVVASLAGDWHWRWETTQPDIVIQGMVTAYERNAGP
jgi:hypothetical protein